MSKKNRDGSYTDGNKRCYVCKSCGLYIYEDLPVWQKKKTKHKNICSKCLGERRAAKETREEKSMFSAYSYYNVHAKTNDDVSHIRREKTNDFQRKTSDRTS